MALVPASAERLKALLVCHTAEVAFHHFPVATFRTATSTLATATSSLAGPRIVTVRGATTASFVGEATEAVGLVRSPEGRGTAGEKTAMRLLPASAT